MRKKITKKKVSAKESGFFRVAGEMIGTLGHEIAEGKDKLVEASQEAMEKITDASRRLKKKVLKKVVKKAAKKIIRKAAKKKIAAIKKKALKIALKSSSKKAAKSAPKKAVAKPPVKKKK